MIGKTDTNVSNRHLSDAKRQVQQCKVSETELLCSLEEDSVFENVLAEFWGAPDR